MEGLNSSPVACSDVRVTTKRQQKETEKSFEVRRAEIKEIRQEVWAREKKCTLVPAQGLLQVQSAFKTIAVVPLWLRGVKLLP